MYIFGPPGWSHDGRSQTSRQMQAELARHKERVLEPELAPVAVPVEIRA
jgi:hypothetical protein